jgi:acetyl-CoA C-acetyltransferase
MASATLAALADSGLEPAEVDAFVVGVAPDALAGVNSPEKSSFFLPPGKPVLRVNTGGATGGSAFATAFALVASGEAEHALALGLERMGQATTAQAVFNTIFDPIFEKDIAISTVTMAALRASMMMRIYGFTTEHWAALAARNYRNGLRNDYAQIRREITIEDVKASPMLAWPVRQYEGCPMSEGACAVVVSSKPRSDDVAWVRGLASRTDTYAMGDRMRRREGSLIDLVTLQLAARHAYEQAGITEPPRQVRVAELQAPFASSEPMFHAALGFCAPDDGPAFLEASLAGESYVQLNPSGGPQVANPVSATALIRIAECALQVRGQAGDHQVPDADWAVAACQGGATQFSIACVLSSAPPEERSNP